MKWVTFLNTIHKLHFRERGNLVNKLIVLIPSKTCYVPVLQPARARNYEKKVKTALGRYYFAN